MTKEFNNCWKRERDIIAAYIVYANYICPARDKEIIITIIIKGGRAVVSDESCYRVSMLRCTL